MIDLNTFLKILKEDGLYEEEEISEFKKWYLEKQKNYTSKKYLSNASEDVWWDYFFSYLYDF